MMSSDEQRIAIAEWMGWSAKQQANGLWLATKNGCVNSSLALESRDAVILASCPDYPNDLNAMHEAEKKCNANYWYQLGKVVGINFGKVIFDIKDQALIAHATSQQRSEALCRTLWPERFESI